ncbi:MAG: recombination-associated protein RdgC [Desulfomonilaceae bacterium]|nr:recombination-associated protein RdgC [Desulfomonilaceae bacterium]
MGFASRSVSIMRYRVKGDVEGSFWDVVDEGVKKYAFREIVGPGEEVGMGWVSVEDFTDTEFRSASYVIGNYVALSLRLDSVRVPTKILEMRLKQESKKLLDESGRQRLSSAQRRELKDNLRETLKKQVFPSIQVFELIWDTARSVVYFGSLSIKARERVEDQFKKSFGLTLVPLIPYLRAEEILSSEQAKDALGKLKPSLMAP